MNPSQPQAHLVPRVVAWETTRQCGLNCRHCRGNASNSASDQEFTAEEGCRMLSGLAEFSRPVLILTGGEPMARRDIYDLAAFASQKGLRVVMAPCGALVTPETVEKMKTAGIKAISISLDGADASTHDSFRGRAGAFDSALAAARFAAEGGLPFQINTTVSKVNAPQLPSLYELAVELGASAVDYFFLVPTGRGKTLRELELDGTTYEQVMNWIYDQSQHSAIGIKTTCAPHYARVQAQRAGANITKISPRFKARGCMAGNGFIFISHHGTVQPCGFLNLDCGRLRDAEFDLKRIYEESTVLQRLRDHKTYHGVCGQCRFLNNCGGCRARAYEATGDYLAAEPNCTGAVLGATPSISE